MTDEPENGVRITITVEVIEDGKALPNKVEQWVLDPSIVGESSHGLHQRATQALPRVCCELLHQLRPQLPLRLCKVCEHYAVLCDEDERGEHHPACEHAPPNPKNAGPRYRSPAVYEGDAGDSDAAPV